MGVGDGVGVGVDGRTDGRTSSKLGAKQCINVQVMSLTSSDYDHFII